MKTLNFITSNQGKLDVMNQLVYKFTDQVSFKMLKLDFEELKLDDSLEGTALNKARTCIGLTDKENVVVSDVGLFIKGLNGFPGPNIGYSMKTIGSEGLIKLMEGINDRSAIFKVSNAYMDKSGNEKVFSAESEVEMAMSVGGENGFGWDNIVLGDGVRFGDDINQFKRLFPYKESIQQIVEYVNSLEQ